MKLCANLDWLFQDLPMKDRFAAAKEAGFDGVEILNPYDLNVQDVVSEVALNDLEMVLINGPPPNYLGGEPGWAAVPGARFENDFKRSLRYAKALQARHIHLMAGVAEGAAAQETFLKNLRFAVSLAPDQSLTIEPLNPKDRPGYFLADLNVGAEIVRQVGASNLGLQFDTYHADLIHGDILSVWSDVKDVVTHVQISQAPNRTEPEDLTVFFEELRASAYSGWVSAEYGPKTGPKHTFNWMKYFTA